MKLPSVVTIVRHRHPGVVGHHVVVDGQDGLAVRPGQAHVRKDIDKLPKDPPEPSHLVPLQVVDHAGELSIPAGCNRDVVNGVDELWHIGTH